MKKLSANQKKKLWTLLIVLCIGVIYYIITQLTSFRLPCPFFTLTGLLCPGCGITRMILSLAKLDLRAAFSYNPAIMCLLPVWCTAFLVHLIWKPRCLSQNGLLFKIIAYGSIAVLVVFGVLRNVM
ncbi:MAG: DUF2752 domain-containing protein [Oscillospiraceae bacterium]|nr:DUF2752 domain-containing protein [Oscillospiraceae bacterium]